MGLALAVRWWLVATKLLGGGQCLMVTKACVTALDLWRLGEGDVRRELINGEVKEMAPLGGRSR